MKVLGLLGCAGLFATAKDSENVRNDNSKHSLASNKPAEPSNPSRWDDSTKPKNAERRDEWRQTSDYWKRSSTVHRR